MAASSSRSSAATVLTGPAPSITSDDGAAARHLADVLAEVADGDAAIDRDLALVGLLLAGDHPEQRRLAGAVRADQADLLALLERRGGFDEENLPAVLLADIVETNHVRAGDPGTDLRRPYAMGRAQGKSVCALFRPDWCAMSNDCTRIPCPPAGNSRNADQEISVRQMKPSFGSRAHRVVRELLPDLLRERVAQPILDLIGKPHPDRADNGRPLVG